ncbi:MAG TPA: hypothetical protein VGL66_08645 [Caulobacteraceae bacterium]|jgi:hypothetical protein
MVGKSLGIAVSLAALGLLGACSSIGADSPAQPSQADAFIVFAKETPGQYLWTVKNPGCGGLFGDKPVNVPRDASESEPFAIAGGKDVNLLAIAWYSRYMCPSIATFTPEAGHTYSVRQRIVDLGCRFEVVDKATGLRPPSYISRSPSDVCPLRWPKIMQVRPRR